MSLKRADPEFKSPESDRLFDKYEELREENKKTKPGCFNTADAPIADAPFKTNWDEFVQKRLLRYAADNGYDGIAWSTGKQQAERWSQSITENIDTLQYTHPIPWK